MREDCARNSTTEPWSEPDSEDDHRESKNATSECTEIVASIFRHLKPYADVLQGDILLEIFRVHPGSISKYFSRKSSFSFDPKLSATWVGYARFVLATIQLPLHGTLLLDHIQQQDQLEILFSTILPQSLTQKVLTRCLNQASNLVTFLTIIILNAALDKLKALMNALEERYENMHLAEMKRATIKEFSARFPEMRHVIAQFRTCPQENQTLNESLTRLIASYYQIFPESALSEKFDISSSLSNALKANNDCDLSRCRETLNALQRDNLLSIAFQSPDMDWWHVPGASAFNATSNDKLSPFTTLLKAYIKHHNFGRSRQMRRILSAVSSESALLRSNEHYNGLDVLCLSLNICQDQDLEEIYAFLDNCILRLVRRPVIYLELSHELLQTASHKFLSSSDLLPIAIAEQWSYLIKSKPSFVIIDITTWLDVYMRLIEVVQIQNALLPTLRAHIIAACDDAGYQAAFENVQNKFANFGDNEKLHAILNSLANGEENVSGTVMHMEAKMLASDFLLLGPPQEPENHPELHRWVHEDIQDAVADGMVGELVFCLCSKDVSIRKESLTQTRLLSEKLKVGSFFERARLN